MIPYDDLVAALSQWRARQGLPVSTLGKQPSGGTPVPQMTQPGSGPMGAMPGSGPTPGSGPRTAPPNAPPRPATPPPLMDAHDDVHEVDDAAMLDEGVYENEGNDFAMSFGKDGGEGEQTSIGGAPERPTDPNGGRGEDW